MVSPLIRRDWKSGVGVAGAVPNAVFSVNSAASHVARRRSAAQIDNVVPFNMIKAQSERPEIQDGTTISSLLESPAY